jgi:hypothetical protein
VQYSEKHEFSFALTPYVTLVYLFQMLCLRAPDAIVRSARGLISQPTEKYTSSFSYISFCRVCIYGGGRKRYRRCVRALPPNKKLQFNAAPCRVLASAKKSSSAHWEKKTHIIINPTRNSKPRHSAHPPTNIRLRKRFFRADGKIKLFLLVCCSLLFLCLNRETAWFSIYRQLLFCYS